MTTERNIPVLYLVIPCYNEEAVLPETTKRLTEKMHTMIRAEQVDPESRILYVDDGSKDKTWAIISEYAEAIPYVDGVKLAHNRGHQNALLAGLMTAMPLCDCAISMDADLQDDINVIDRFVEKYMEGCDVVYGVRNKRETDTFFKRTTAEGFYKFMKILGVDVVFNHADYRLMSRRALEGLSEYKEVNLFLRGIVPLIGFKSDYVYYDRAERFAGESKYPLKKMISFALDGITSFSVKPLKLISNLGILISVLSIFGLLYALISHLCGVTVAGWTAIVASIWLLGGLQMLCLGVVGGYIGKAGVLYCGKGGNGYGTHHGQSCQQRSQFLELFHGLDPPFLFFISSVPCRETGNGCPFCCLSSRSIRPLQCARTVVRNLPAFPKPPVGVLRQVLLLLRRPLEVQRKGEEAS